jgi:hypothetical protein
VDDIAAPYLGGLLVTGSMSLTRARQVMKWYIEKGLSAVPIHPKEASVEVRSACAAPLREC